MTPLTDMTDQEIISEIAAHPYLGEELAKTPNDIAGAVARAYERGNGLLTRLLRAHMQSGIDRAADAANDGIATITYQQLRAKYKIERSIARARAKRNVQKI